MNKFKGSNECFFFISWSWKMVDFQNSNVTPVLKNLPKGSKFVYEMPSNYISHILKYSTYICTQKVSRYECTNLRFYILLRPY